MGTHQKKSIKYNLKNQLEKKNKWLEFNYISCGLDKQFENEYIYQKLIYKKEQEIGKKNKNDNEFPKIIYKKRKKNKIKYEKKHIYKTR